MPRRPNPFPLVVSWEEVNPSTCRDRRESGILSFEKPRRSYGPQIHTNSTLLQEAQRMSTPVVPALPPPQRRRETHERGGPGWKILSFIANRIVQTWGPGAQPGWDPLHLPPPGCLLPLPQAAPSSSLSRYPEPPPLRPLVRPVPPPTLAPPCYLRYVDRFPPPLHGTSRLPGEAWTEGRDLAPTPPPAPQAPPPPLEGWGRAKSLLLSSHGN